VAAIIGAPSGLGQWAAARYGADSVDIDETDKTAASVTLVIRARQDASLLDLAYTFRRNVTAASGEHAHLDVAGSTS
jgi:hypothetical protein